MIRATQATHLNYLNVGTQRRIMRQPEVCYATGLPKSTLYYLIAEGRFPKPMKLGLRSAGWLASDVEAWIEARHAESLAA
jgi:prophage regulatory protein